MYRAAADLNVRPVPELGTCIVYRPRPPALLSLNLSAWLVLEIVTENPGTDPWPEFWPAVRHAHGEDTARGLMQAGVERLAAMRLIEPLVPESGATTPQGATR